jgi:hypothetical protein
MKYNRGFDKFLLRGISGASSELWLSYLAHSVLKLCTSPASASRASIYRLLRSWLRPASQLWSAEAEILRRNTVTAAVQLSQ